MTKETKIWDKVVYLSIHYWVEWHRPIMKTGIVEEAFVAKEKHYKIKSYWWYKFLSDKDIAHTLKELWEKMWVPEELLWF